MKPQRGFDAALAAAELSDAPRTARKMGASLWAGPRLLSVGYNRWQSHPSSDNTDFNRSLHAENVAIIRRQYYDKLSGFLALYVARRLADGSMGCSRPCPNCLALAGLAGVRRVWFYNTDGKPEEVSL